MKKMERFNLNLVLISFKFVLLILFTHNLLIISAQLGSTPSKDILSAFCGKGTLKPSNSNTSFLGFECECFTGWIKPRCGSFTFPSCVLPNCTIPGFQCGTGSSPPAPLSPSPPPPPPPSPPDILNLCPLAFCGNGTCVNKGIPYTCQCNEGSKNIMNLTALPCLNPVKIHADCNGLVVQSPPPPSSSGSSNTGLKNEPNCSRKLRSLLAMVLAAIFLVWI